MLAVEGATTVQSFSVPNHSRPLNQFDLNDFVCELNLSKECVEKLIFRLKENYLINDNVRAPHYRKRHDEID